MTEPDRLETALARKMGIPYDLDSFYMPLVSPSEVIETGVSQNFIIPRDKIDMGKVATFCSEIAPFYNRDLIRHSEVMGYGLGLGYSEPDNFIYDAVVKAYDPDLIVEIGCGISTFYARGATQKRIICVEPYPGPHFAEWCQSANVELWQMPLQEAADKLPFLGKVLLFVDSTHVAKITSELHLVFTKLLPQLPTGSLIHFHDIFLPFPCLRPDHNSFPQTVNWYESVLLGIFLQASEQYEVVLPQYWMGFEEPGRTILGETIPFYRETGAEGSAFWMRKTGKP